MALQLPNLWLPITELPQTGFYLSRSSHRVFLPTEAVCLTLWNPRKPLSGLPTLCSSLLPRFHASTLFRLDLSLLWSFTALTNHFWFLISDSSCLTTHRLCSLAAITSRRVWLLFLRLPDVVSVFQPCFRPKQVPSFFIAAFFPLLGPSLSDCPLIHLCCRSNRCSVRHLLLLSFRFLLPSFERFRPLQSMHSKSKDLFLRWFHTFIDCSFAPSNYRFCHCLYSLRLKLSPINEGSFSQDPLLCLFTLSVYARHSPSFHQLLRCLPSNENGQHSCCDTSCFRFINSIPESVLALDRWPLFPVSFTTRFPQYALAYCVSLAAFVPIPPCLHHTLFALRPFCILHPLWLGISQTRTAILFAGFYRVVLSESYIFLGTVLLFQAPIGTFQSQRFLLKMLLLVFNSTQYFMCKIFLVDDSLYSVHQFQRSNFPWFTSVNLHFRETYQLQ